jgi:hypothetical protein
VVYVVNKLINKYYNKHGSSPKWLAKVSKMELSSKLNNTEIANTGRLTKAASRQACCFCKNKKEIIMAEPRAFISFDFDLNEISRRLFVGQGKTDSPTPFTVHDWSSKTDLPQSQWEQLIKEKINKCDVMIVLVGNNMGSAAGVAKEIKFARENNVPFFGVYVDGATATSTLPAGLARNRVIGWKWDAIASAIEQMMNEGKNS